MLLDDKEFWENLDTVRNSTFFKNTNDSFYNSIDRYNS